MDWILFHTKNKCKFCDRRPMIELNCSWFYRPRADFCLPELSLCEIWTRSTCFYFLVFAWTVFRLYSQPNFFLSLLPFSILEFVGVIVSTITILSWMFRRAMMMIRCHDIGPILIHLYNHEYDKQQRNHWSKILRVALSNETCFIILRKKN